MALIGSIWFRDFPAWAIQRNDRALGYHPFFVHHRGSVVATSELAHAAGILVGWSVQRALSLVGDAEAVPLDTAATDYAWREILNALYTHTPRIEAVRPGLAYFEVPKRLEGQKALADWVLDTGAQCGVAEGRALAELAAYHAMAGAVCPVPAKSAKSFLASLPVETLAPAGVTPATLERLPWFGWDTVGSLGEVEARHLMEQFEDGKIVARFAAAGMPSPAETAPVTVYSPPATIAARIVFDQAATEPGEWEPAFDELLPRLCNQLNGREGGTLTLVAVTNRGRRIASSWLREPIREARRLMEPVLDLSRLLFAEDSEVHSLQVELGALQVHLHQEELFDSSQKRHERLREGLRQLKARGVADIVRFRVRDAFAAMPEEMFEIVPWLDSLPAPAAGRHRRVAA